VVAGHRFQELDIAVLVGVGARVDHVHRQLELGVGVVQREGFVLHHLLVADSHDHATGGEGGQGTDRRGNEEHDDQDRASLGSL
jgi:hypothetical protein